MVCIRTAWLDLYGDGTVTLPLEDESAGYFCTELDLGFPSVREVTTNKPDMDGADDRTRLMGSRAVTANITALLGAGAQVDAVASSFGKYLVPSARPVLHYILDRPGTPERMITLRAAGYDWPISGPYERDLQLSWVAPDPLVRDPVGQTKTAWSGSATAPGRIYNLTFDRIYPPGSGAPSTVELSTPGDVGARPKVDIYGPITKPQLVFQRGPGGAYSYFTFQASFIVNAGQWVEIDSERHTVMMGGQSVLSSVDWSQSVWPYVPPEPQIVIMSLSGSSTSGNTQAVASWNDGYLT
jgi:hypothetical protein